MYKDIYEYNDDKNSNYIDLHEQFHQNSIYEDNVKPDKDFYKDNKFEDDIGIYNTGMNTFEVKNNINDNFSINDFHFDKKDFIFINFNNENPEEEITPNEVNILHLSCNGPEKDNNKVQYINKINFLNRKRNNPINVEMDLIPKKTNNNILFDVVNNNNNNNNNNNSNNDYKEMTFHIEKVPKKNIYENIHNYEYINNSNLPKYIHFSNSSIFNYNEFKNNYDKNKNSIFNKINEFDKELPPFFSIEEIKNIPFIKQLWSGNNSIYNSEEDFNNSVRYGIIYTYLFNYLNKIKNKDIKVSHRNHKPDEMSQKYKTFVIQGMINSINSFKEMKNNEIDKIDIDSIYGPIKADFQLALLKKEMFTIISNDVNSTNIKCNYQKIEKIIKEYNEKKKHMSLIKHLLLTFQDCLDIILYKKEDPNKIFTKKLIDFLNCNYKKLNCDIITKKDYIAALLLLGYNFERLFNLKPKRAFREQC